ncbi:MAG: hypothetical protein BWX71_01152 [Deltaproteobacteria bacterium ADurb.Bin072]|nr:MAG: hypothetical protein BWX71_01152 [Deltaproteobacteria bacterium ADurb.Bin072]
MRQVRTHPRERRQQGCELAGHRCSGGKAPVDQGGQPHAELWPAQRPSCRHQDGQVRRDRHHGRRPAAPAGGDTQARGQARGRVRRGLRPAPAAASRTVARPGLRGHQDVASGHHRCPDGHHGERLPGVPHPGARGLCQIPGLLCLARCAPDLGDVPLRCSSGTARPPRLGPVELLLQEAGQPCLQHDHRLQPPAAPAGEHPRIPVHALRPHHPRVRGGELPGTRGNRARVLVPGLHRGHLLRGAAPHARDLR